MSRAHPAAWSDEALLLQCDVTRGRGSGPGGQHRNKVETRVVITHRPSGCIGQAQERRAQGQNKTMALFRLRLCLAQTIRQTPDEVSERWRARCSKNKIACRDTHPDFPAILAEALDHVYANGLEPRPAADALGCSPSQLIKLIKKHPGAFLDWNRARSDAGLAPLR